MSTRRTSSPNRKFTLNRANPLFQDESTNILPISKPNGFAFHHPVGANLSPIDVVDQFLCPIEEQRDGEAEFYLLMDLVMAIKGGKYLDPIQIEMANKAEEALLEFHTNVNSSSRAGVIDRGRSGSPDVPIITTFDIWTDGEWAKTRRLVVEAFVPTLMKNDGWAVLIGWIRDLMSYLFHQDVNLYDLVYESTEIPPEMENHHLFLYIRFAELVIKEHAGLNPQSMFRSITQRRPSGNYSIIGGALDQAKRLLRSVSSSRKPSSKRASRSQSPADAGQPTGLNPSQAIVGDRPQSSLSIRSASSDDSVPQSVRQFRSDRWLKLQAAVELDDQDPDKTHPERIAPLYRIIKLGSDIAAHFKGRDVDVSQVHRFLQSRV